MINKTTTFTLETLIFVDKGVLTSPWAIFDLMALVDFVSGESNCGHQVPRALEQIQPFIRKQLPWLADVPDLDGIDSREKLNHYLLEQIERFGSSHELNSMPDGVYDNWDAQHALAEQEAKEDQEQRADAQHVMHLPGGAEIRVDFSVDDIVKAGGRSISEMFGKDE